MAKKKSKQNRKDKKASVPEQTFDLEAGESQSTTRRLLGNVKRRRITRSPSSGAHHAKSSSTPLPGPVAVDKTDVLAPLTICDGQESESSESIYLSLQREGSGFDSGSNIEATPIATGDTAHLVPMTDSHPCATPSSIEQDNEQGKECLEKGNPRLSDSDRVETTMSVVEHTGLRDKVAVEHDVQDPSHEVHFMKGARQFEISGGQFISARGNVSIANYSEDHFFSMLPYAEGAGIDTTKACLNGTRIGILTKIQDWITSTDKTVPRILWLSGLAGTGKSAIAHTIAHWWISKCKGFGSCFCFNRQAPKRHENLFTTIARDLVPHIPGLKDYLIRLVTAEPGLPTSPDATQQWQKLIQEPVVKLLGGVSKPVLIVIDALDESGEAISRRHILSILMKDAVHLPSNFRIVVTSRPLSDIIEAFSSTRGIRSESMDHISRSSTENDIQLYIYHQMTEIDGIDNRIVSQLTQKSDGLFEWARLACEYIKYAKGFLTKREWSEELVANAGGSKTLLDDMYKMILHNIMGPHPDNVTLGRFHSVLRLALSTQEPLPMESLDVLHSNMCMEHGHYRVVTVLQHFGSLLSGISDQSMPVHALHATFYEFLTTKDRSGPFFIDFTDVNVQLGSTCLQVMSQHLHFNICNLESSYVFNSQVVDLSYHIQEDIKPYLSYSCCFWADHIKLTQYQESLACQISAFLLNEKMLFWLEVLGLLNCINIAPTMLGNVANWFLGNNHDDVVKAIRDGINLCRIFGNIISKSTPHLYLSALPFLPKDSILGEHLFQKFKGVPIIAAGKKAEWPNLQLSIRGHTGYVTSVAFSPDGKRIASGSDDKTVCIWDAETGVQVGSPLKGHTDYVTSVAFSPDGKRIASGSDDETVCIWDAETGVQVGSPLKGHTHYVRSVAFSPDGKRIASGSDEDTVIWNAETGVLHSTPVIKFSSRTEHTLHKPYQLFENIQEDWRSHISVNHNTGWITGPHACLLMWLPPSSREQLLLPKMHVIIPHPVIELDLSKMAHGNKWHQCYQE